MKPLFCRFQVTSFVRFLLTLDMFRGMLFSALLVGLFCGMATVNVGGLKEVVLANNRTRVDFYGNREMFVGCIVIGISICGSDIMMALALDHIIHKNLGKASLVWMNCSLLGIILRGAFYICLSKYEQYLGLDRLDDLTPTVKRIAHAIFRGAVAYELVKIVQLIAGAASLMEFRNQDGSASKNQVAPKRIKVGMIGGSKRWID